MSDLKRIAVSQRVDVLAGRNERRDALDQRWSEFLAACGAIPVSMPNAGAGITRWLEGVGPQGIILSGGNDLAALGGDAPERDQTEDTAVAWADRAGIPVLGVCRGMQFLAHRSGAHLEKREGHVATRHEVNGLLGERNVNSYHNWCVPNAPPMWQILARCTDGTIEAFRHTTLPHLGLMWHPEREPAFDNADIELFRQHFGS